MNLEEEIGRLKRMITASAIMKSENSMESYADLEYIKDADAVEIVLQEIERLQKEKAEYEARWNNTAHELRIFENECVPKNEIRKLIELWKPKLEETDKREEEAQTQEERVVLKCIGIRLDERIKTLQDLLKEE